MSKYSTLKAEIIASIKRNGAQAITGDLLQEKLLSMIDSLGEHYQFGGLALPSTEFTPGDEPVVFIAATPGTYTDFGGLVVADGEVALLVWDGSTWSKQTTDIATRTEVSQLGQYVDGLVEESIEDDFSIIDDNGNAIVLFKRGHIMTKNFDSENVERTLDVVEDFAIQDENDNAIVLFKDGHIKTKNFDSKSVGDTLLICDDRYSGYNLVTVGSGRDYPTIQQAINSISDARPDNQYLILVYDDFYVTDITELWKWSNKNQKITSISDIDNGETCAYIWTKDYVHILGKGQRTIYVNLPTNVIDTDTRRSRVHNIYHKGSGRLENLKIVSQNCRYCIHSEGGDGRDTSLDYCAKKEFVNLECVYIGHEGGSFQMAFGVGTASGLQLTVKNCKFIGQNGATSGYFHTHANYKFPATLTFENSIFTEEGVDGEFNIGELFSGQNNIVNVIGCEFKHIAVSYGIYSPVDGNTSFDIRDTRINIHGHGNKIRMGAEILPVLYIQSANNNQDITDVSGSAFDALFKDCLRYEKADANNKSLWVGCMAAMYSSANTYNNNFGSIGYRLGDCSVNNKVLSITVDGHTEIVTFNKNYGGLSGSTPVANFSDQEIIAEINEQLTYCRAGRQVNFGRYHYDDEVVLAYNDSNERIDINKFVTRDNNISWYKNAVKYTTEDDNIFGITIQPIEAKGYGYVLLKGKGLLWLTTGLSLGLLFDVRGKYLKAGNSGTLVEAQNKGEAFLFGIDQYTLEWI